MASTETLYGFRSFCRNQNARCWEFGAGSHGMAAFVPMNCAVGHVSSTLQASSSDWPGHWSRAARAIFD